MIAAITASSWLFAFADYYDANSDILSQDNQMYADYLGSKRADIDIAAIYLDKIIAKIKQKMDSGEIDEQQGSEDLKHYEGMGQSYFYDMKLCESALRAINKRNKRKKVYSIINDICSTLGFLMFFCILVFQSVSAIAISCQDYLTAWAFAMIMLSQFLRLTSNQKRKEKLAEFKIAKEMSESLRENFRREVEK